MDKKIGETISGDAQSSVISELASELSKCGQISADLFGADSRLPCWLQLLIVYLLLGWLVVQTSYFIYSNCRDCWRQRKQRQD